MKFKRGSGVRKLYITPGKPGWSERTRRLIEKIIASVNKGGGAPAKYSSAITEILNKKEGGCGGRRH